MKLRPRDSNRLRELGLFALLLLVALAARLYRLQIQEQVEHARRAAHYSVASEAIPAPRGRILDRHGRILVSNAPQYELVVIPAELEDRQSAIQQAATLLEEEPTVFEEKLREAHPLQPLVLRRDLQGSELARATVLTETTPGFAVRSGSIRRYRYGSMAAHLLGYTAEINTEELRVRRERGYTAGDPIGKLGLEKQYDEILRGRKGLKEIMIDVLGRTVTEDEVRVPVAGPDLILTLDAELQQTAESRLAQTLSEIAAVNGERSGGAVVVLDAKTGAVRAMACLPQYDPKLFSRGITSNEFRALLEDPGLPLVNRLIHSSFSPGSVFKLVTGTAGLQAGSCTPFTVFYCGGSYAGANCFARGGHGSIDFESSVAQSCNVVYYRLGLQMGIEKLTEICAAYGLGSPTGIDLPGEVGGLLPTPAWKRAELDDAWYEGDTVNLSIGQGYLLVSPLQMAVATAAVANGGTVVQPYLAQRAVSGAQAYLYRAEPESRPLPMASEFLAAMRRGMRGAVTHGTSTAASLEQVEVAGKTGTIENSPSISNPKGRNHAWFVSFAPYRDPEHVVVVFLEASGGFGGSLAAPIAADVYRFLYPDPKAPEPNP